MKNRKERTRPTTTRPLVHLRQFEEECVPETEPCDLCCEGGSLTPEQLEERLAVDLDLMRLERREGPVLCAGFDVTALVEATDADEYFPCPACEGEGRLLKNGRPAGEKPGAL